MYGSSYYWNFRTSSFKQVACLILQVWRYIMSYIVSFIVNKKKNWHRNGSHSRFKSLSFSTQKVMTHRIYIYSFYSESDVIRNLHRCDCSHRKWWQRRFTLLWWCTQKMMIQEIYTALIMYTENDDTGDLHCSDDVHRKWWYRRFTLLW